MPGQEVGGAKVRLTPTKPQLRIPNRVPWTDDRTQSGDEQGRAHELVARRSREAWQRTKDREDGNHEHREEEEGQDDRQQRSEGVGPSGTGLGWAGLAGIMNAWMKSANEPETQRRGAAAARPIVIGDRVKRAYCWCCGLRTLRRRHRITPIRAWRHGASLRLPGLARRRRMTRKHSLPAEAGAGISHTANQRTLCENANFA
ncbi:hypothetical protein VTN96DRAFT_665 [Rasamsonia emersonii]